jgi:hypothetical protein
MADRQVRVYGHNYGRVPDELLWDATVSDAACRLYAVLTRYGQQRDRIAPPRKELAERLHWSINKLDRTRAELERAGALYVEQRSDPRTGRHIESAYWLDGKRPRGVLPKSGEGVLPTDGEYVLPTDGETIKTERDSATTVAGSGAAEATNGDTPQTFLARLIDYVRQTTGDDTYRPDPREIGKLTDCFALRISVGDPAEVIDAGARDWADAQPSRDASQLASFIGARRRARPAKGRGDQRTRDGDSFTRAPRPPDHDGRHDRTCWCWERPSNRRTGMSALDRAALYASTGDPRWAPRNGDHDPADPPTMPIEEQQARLAAIIAAEEAATVDGEGPDRTVP